MSAVLDEVQEALTADPEGNVRVPALVRGRLVLAPAATPRPTETPAVDGAYLLRRPVLDAGLEPTGALRTMIVPAVDPAELGEDPRAALELLSLPFREVLDYVGALRAELDGRPELVRAVVAAAGATTPTGAQATEARAQLLHGLLDPSALGEAVDRDLGSPDTPGRRYLDEWVEATGPSRSGLAAELSHRLFPPAGGEPPPAPRMRAVPTRQLHITAGNSPMIPMVSALRALATKSPAVIKSSSGSVLAATLLAVAMHAVDPGHPITRHTSLVCWPGGDRRVEDVLFSRGRFDRLAVWGSAATVESVRSRADGIRTVVLEPRTGVSLIGGEALAGDLAGAAVRAAADSLAEDQQSCSASLVHYVEADRAGAREYCEALRRVLARWDAAVPSVAPRESVGRLRRLRRGELARADWFVNRLGGVVSSSVVCVGGRFDVAAHPAGRCVVVRPVDDLAEAVDAMHPGISTAGVAPEERRTELRDALAARGVSSVVALGDAERAFAGMPHDGMRILSELVGWATA